MRKSSGELPWTEEETRGLMSHADVISALRQKVENNTATPPEFARFAKAVSALEKAVNDKERLAGDVIVAEDKEGNEVRFDLAEILRTSDTFFRGKHLEVLADALPSYVRLSQEQVERIKEAAKEGFDRAFLFAPLELLDTNNSAILTACAKEHLANLTGDDQYTEPFVDTTAQTPVTRNRPTGKAYLLLYSSKPVAQETKDLTFPQVAELFKQNKWNGLTLQEHLILQRFEAEVRGDHSFDAYSTDAGQSNWTWLMDSTSDASAARVLDADWSPDSRRVRVYSGSSGSRGPALGARSSVVLVLES